MRPQRYDSIDRELMQFNAPTDGAIVDAGTSPEIATPHTLPGRYLRAKRMIDVIAVIGAAPAVLVVVALAAIAILLTMGRPILFIQDRVGLDGRVFKMLKLRTMRHGSFRLDHATVRNDPRITPLGAFLRRTHIDELPQLWNLLKGDMTLIGPRPEQPHLVDYYRKHIPDYDKRHTVPPGLTGLSQVFYGYAADLEETRQKIVYDLEYVRNIGLSTDLRIFIQTIRVYSSPELVR
jgi:lipopolysaccharide/colanic/teichoic acid biosynthesis glycosyltransferase